MNLGFQDQFETFVVDGSKRHSMRAGDRWSVGMRADLFVRIRQPGMRLLFRAWVTKVQRVVIEWKSGSLTCGIHLTVTIDGTELAPDEMEGFFYRDGFRNPGTLPSWQAEQFWRKDLRKGPWVGQIVHWDWTNRFTEKTGSIIKWVKPGSIQSDPPVRSEISNAMLRRVMMPEYLGGRKVD